MGAVTYATFFTGALSVLGASLIIDCILRHDKKPKVVTQVVMYLSIADMLVSWIQRWLRITVAAPHTYQYESSSSSDSQVMSDAQLPYSRRVTYCCQRGTC
jgi:hypothetical protein